MRYFFAVSVLAAGAMATSATDYLKCASAALGSADTSTFDDCASKSAQECLCDNKDALSKLSKEAAEACSGVDLSSLTDALCSSSREAEAAPARHASSPMMLADPLNKRAFAPQAESPASAVPAVPRVVYVTETKTDCSCKSTPAPDSKLAHISQIPVDVPASASGSAMPSMAVASSPAGHSHVPMGAASSVAFGSQASAATPMPSGADPNRYSSFQGAAAPSASVHGVAAVGVAAVMALMVAL
ncbi:unnamed protein product [Penicillium salamii]|uniref:Extracellular membrane protein CFEM domain-containing protein n=1 Tax=Penicillium salamii TaxID=1612424 RepID=A0A9W4NW90_9EURO|nr:unnamed protein product [Penicillium salamii]CAG8161433.1 unnamed protein product [Penicillium salamii]CAG8162123.1 unnamed protein product [Penicillium salamii]CAG8166477.1 unnamed protein product [Penicillium salamii]CAG8234607.1 unnamed protein product [Penicillium salamii]